MIKKDETGSEYVVKVYDPAVGMEGFLVIDNTVLGPGKGGIRMTPTVNGEEVWRLARAMTYKNALAGIPFGGAKSGIVWKGGADDLKKKHIQSFAKAIKIFIPKKYIAGPDINTGEKEMKWFAEATGDWRSTTGKPADFCVKNSKNSGKKCGLPHELGSTGFGVAHAAKIAADIYGMNLKKANVSIHGFGNVGFFAYKFLTEMGAKIIAISDSKGVVFSKSGFDTTIISGLIKNNKKISEYPYVKKLKKEEFWNIPADIMITASVTDVINGSNHKKIQAKIIVEGANISVTKDAEGALFKKGVITVPDIIVNSGGVISSYAEYRGYDSKKMFKMIEEKITKSVRTVLEESKKQKKNPREIALLLAKEKIKNVKI